jgi:molybdopterin-guanine dinucleotide biosynthesis protein A
VPDEYPGKGPKMGIYSSLKASGGPAAVVLSCDMPFVSDNLVGYLLALRHKGDVVVPWHGGDHWEPLCAVYDKAVLRKMESFIKRGCYKLPDMFPEVSTYAIPAGTIQDIFGVDVFFNVNTPRDLTVVRGIE